MSQRGGGRGEPKGVYFLAGKSVIVALAHSGGSLLP